MRNLLKICFYRTSKALGLFHLSRRLTKNGLRILCYHGFALDDEDKFRPGLFMSAATFKERLRRIAEHGFPVVELGEALELRERNVLPPCATVITIDDGFYSVYCVALQALWKYGFPATLYLTSYYFLKGTPIFRLVVSYMFWKTRKASANLSALEVPGLDGDRGQVLTAQEKDRLAEIITEYGETRLDEPSRCALSERLGRCLGVDYRPIVDSRIFTLIGREQAAALLDAGIDIQLHTHRHDLPSDHACATREIDENKAAIGLLVGRVPEHFCYPSGTWSKAHWHALKDSGVRSAVTCDPGLVYPDTPSLALNRILDDARVSQIEFEAEMYGFCELIRRAQALLGKRRTGFGRD